MDTWVSGADETNHPNEASVQLQATKKEANEKIYPGGQRGQEMIQ